MFGSACASVGSDQDHHILSVDSAMFLLDQQQRHWLDCLAEAVLRSNHNLCFWAEIRKIMYTPVNPIFIPRHTIVAGYYGFTLVIRESVRLSVHPSYIRFSFPDDNFNKHQWIFTKLGMCIDIQEGLGLLMGKFCQFLHGVICSRNACIFVSRL